MIDLTKLHEVTTTQEQLGKLLSDPGLCLISVDTESISEDDRFIAEQIIARLDDIDVSDDLVLAELDTFGLKEILYDEPV